MSAADTLDMELLKGLAPRPVGPAGMSGRVTSIDVPRGDLQTIYVGTASGGLWKSTSGGIDWEVLTDETNIASVGAVAVCDQIPDIIWVGTGEGNPRNSHTGGTGLYKSIDGGKNWRLMGLPDSRNIHRIIIHRDNPDIVTVGVTGSAWGDSKERGVYQTRDGGESWKQLLYVNERTGCADLVVDPSNPNKMFAAMWEHRREPWFFTSGGPGSGLYVTFDGGANWKQLTSDDGLPEGELGRIGLAIPACCPERVYALVESKKNALYRSDDGGFTFKKINDKSIGNRPFYYCEIHADPQNENRLYNLFSQVSVSEDGGKDFSVLLNWNTVHPDHHAWWINPDNPKHMIDGNDGGLNVTYDRGESWRFVTNLPLAQFYHINVDRDTPYHIYGGMQDNGSWRGPSYVWRWGGVRNAYWEEVAFGDGFDVVPDPRNSMAGYAMWQGGNLLRYDIGSGASRYIRPVHPQNQELRFNWNAAIAADPFTPDAIYYGSQFLHYTNNQGESWQLLSPDLTTNDSTKQKQDESGGLTIDATNAENYTTIVSIAPSPLDQQVIWVGTDDGNIQLTRDRGASWTNSAGKLPGAPRDGWITQIKASKYAAGEAFVVIDNHRLDDWAPYVYQTKNFGVSWTRLVGDKDVNGYALSFAQDHVEPKLMFVGTELGLYFSLDGGTSWQHWTQGYPHAVSTMDMVIHPDEPDLIIGTFGRAAWVFDDITALRRLARDGRGVLKRPLTLFEVPDAYAANYRSPSGTRFAADAEFRGENRDYGAMLTFNIYKDTTAAQDTSKTMPPDSVRIEILDVADTVRTLKRKIEPGINRMMWDLSRRGVRGPTTPKPEGDAPEPDGGPVAPGDYKVRIYYGENVDSSNVRVHPDPREEFNAAIQADIDRFAEQYRKIISATTAAADRLREAKARSNSLTALLKDRQDSLATAVRDTAAALNKHIDSLMDKIRRPDGQGLFRDHETISARLDITSWFMFWTRRMPSDNALVLRADTEKRVREFLDMVNVFFRDRWPDLQRTFEAANIELFEEYEAIEIEP